MRHVAIVALAWTVGCGGSEAEPPGDSAPAVDTGPDCTADVWITHGEGGCFGADDAWEFKADVAGCAETALLNMWRADGSWDEQHPLAIYQEGPDRTWQAWIGGPLTHQAAPDAWEPGVSTSFDCQLDTAPTFAVRMLDTDGSLLSCAVWGVDPQAIIDGQGSAVNSDAPSSFAGCEIKPF